MMSIPVGEVEIGNDKPPFIIAEMSGNHNQSLERALAIVDAIADSGAHALKLQTYTADTLTINITDGEFFISDKKNLWQGNSLYELYQSAYTPWEWHEVLFKRAKDRGLIAFSTPFDETAVDFLESLNVPAYKIASFENTYLGLIRKVAATGKPVIISTGMATVSEIDETVRTARDIGCKNLILLKCTSSYPASPAASNLASIPHLRALFNCEVGLSDHTLGIGAAVASVVLGASVIEKHVTLNRAEGGVDAAFSLEPHELKQLVLETRNAWQAIGHPYLGITEEESNSRVFRRSLYICEDMEKGAVLTSKNLRAIRPGYGLPEKYYSILLGRKVNKNIAKGTAVSWMLID